MQTDQWDLEDLITQAEADIKLNPIEFIQVGTAAIQIVEAEDRRRGLYTLQVAPILS